MDDRGGSQGGALLGQGLARGVCQAVPVGGVCEQVGQYGSQEGEGDLLCVQAEDAVEQLHHPIRPLLPRLLQQFLGRSGMEGVASRIHDALSFVFM